MPYTGFLALDHMRRRFTDVVRGMTVDTAVLVTRFGDSAVDCLVVFIPLPTRRIVHETAAPDAATEG